MDSDFCRIVNNNNLEVKTATVSVGPKQSRWSYTVPSSQSLVGIKSLRISFSGGFWNAPSINCNLETGVITLGGGGSTVDTRGTFTITYSYLD